MSHLRDVIDEGPLTFEAIRTNRFFTTEEQIYELFSRVGEIKRIIMGLDRNLKTPCGFCFVE